MASPTTKRWSSGLFRGSRYTTEPYDDSSDTLQFILNGYVPDAVNGSGVYSRPGFTELDGPGGTIWGIYTMTALNGTPYNFVVADAKLYRVDVSSDTFTDVTPAGITISDGRRVYMTSLGDNLIVNDGVNPPWIGTNLGGSPITGTKIVYSGGTTVYLRMPSITNTNIGWNALTVYVNGVAYALTNNDLTGIALPAGTIPAAQWGVYRVSYDPNLLGYTVTAGAANYTTGYATEAAALVALPAVPSGHGDMGYFTVRAALANPFIAGTSALATGTGGNPASATNYYAPFAAWSAYGQPVIYAGSVFFILNTVENGLSARSSIAWSEPNLPDTGYQQTDYDNTWELTQTGSTPLYRLVATNDALYYSRRLSWGALAGTPNINFANTATHDVVSGNVGCVSPAGACLFLNYVYFLDQQGRPWRFAVGGTPEPLWLQLRGIYTDHAGEYDSTDVENFGWMAVEPSTNTILFDFTDAREEVLPYVLTMEANTGRFLGGWDVEAGGFGITYGGLLTYGATSTSDNQTVLGVAAGEAGHLWYVQRPDQNQFWDVRVGDVEGGVTFTGWSGQLGYSLADKMQLQEVMVLLVAATGGEGVLPATASVRVSTTQELTTGINPTTIVANEPVVRGEQGRYVAKYGRPMGRDASVSVTTTATSETYQLAIIRIEATAVVSLAGIRDA